MDRPFIRPVILSLLIAMLSHDCLTTVACRTLELVNESETPPCMNFVCGVSSISVVLSSATSTDRARRTIDTGRAVSCSIQPFAPARLNPLRFTTDHLRHTRCYQTPPCTSVGCTQAFVSASGWHPCSRFAEPVARRPSPMRPSPRSLRRSRQRPASSCGTTPSRMSSTTKFIASR